MLHRINIGGATEHVDFFEYVLPSDAPVPDGERDLTMQLMFASYGPTGD